MLEEIKAQYEKGHQLKEEARKSNLNLEKYSEAAKYFDKAANLLNDYIKKPELIFDDSVQSKVFFNYYLSEKHSCLYSFYYEKHQTTIAKENLEKTIAFISKAIKIIKSDAPNCSADKKAHLESFLPKWEYFLKNEEIQIYAPDARKYWDLNQPVEALDIYRRMSKKLYDLISYTKSLEIEPVYERIAIGNYIGSIANESAAMAKIFLSKSINGKVSTLNQNELFSLLRHTFDAAQFGRKAYLENPEWEQYLIGAQQTENNIVNLLKTNSHIWLPTYLYFEDDKEFLKFMKRIDLEKFKDVEAKVHFTQNKAGKLWSIGSFWLLLFLIIVGVLVLLFSSNFSWWQIILLIIFTETILLIIGAFSLRTLGDLSEQNFLKLIKISLSHQFSNLKYFTKKGLDKSS